MTSDFFGLNEDDQVARLTVLARKSLIDWGIENADVWLLKYRENAVFGVWDPKGKCKYALRLHREGYHSDTALLSELQWMQALNASGVKTSPVIPTIDGRMFTHVEGAGVQSVRQCDLLGWVDGEPLGTIETGSITSAETTQQNYFKTGVMAARLHNHAQEWVAPQGFWRHSWDANGLIGDEPLWGQFWQYKELTSEQRSIVLQVRIKLRKDLTVFGKDKDRYGLTHADFLPENLLIDGGCLRVIDFDDCGYGWHMMDLATALFFLLEDPNFDVAFEGFVAGYRSVRELPDAHLKMLPAFFIARGLVYLSWCHTRSETDTAKEFGPVIVQAVDKMAQDYLNA